jgi:hypothetical protein
MQPHFLYSACTSASPEKKELVIYGIIFISKYIFHGSFTDPGVSGILILMHEIEMIGWLNLFH